MTDLAVLATRFEAQGVEQTEAAYKRIESGAQRVQRATDALSASNTRAKTATGAMAEAMQGGTGALRQVAEAATRSEAAVLRSERAAKQLGGALGDMAARAATGTASLDTMANSGARATTALASMGARAAIVGGAIAMLAGAVAGLGYLWLQGEKSALAYEKAATGVGRTAGLTASELRNLTVEAARNGDITINAARDQATAYLATGNVGREVLGDLIALGRDYAVFMGVDAKTATRQLAAAMEDPAKAAVEMTNQFGLLTRAQIVQIEKMQEAGNVMGAQKALMDSMKGTISGHSNDLQSVTSAWDAIGRAISNAIQKAGEYFYVTENERLGVLNRRIASMDRHGYGTQREYDALVAERNERERIGMARRNNQRIQAATAQGNQQAQRTWEAGEDRRREAQRRAEQAAREAENARKRAAQAAEREYRSLIEGAERYRDSLIQQVATHGMTEAQILRYTAAQRVRTLVDQGATAEAIKLGNAIRDQAEAYALLLETQNIVKPTARERPTPYAADVPTTRDLAAADLMRTINALREIEDLSYRAGYGMAEAFGEAGRAIADLTDTMATFPAAYSEIARALVQGEIDQAKATQMRRDLTIQTYGDMASAAKGFFAEGSRGYRAMEAVERVYRAWQMAASIQSIAQGWIEASQSVAQATVKAGADTAAGGAKMFSQLGVWAFPAVAAMVAVMAGLGAKSGGGASSYTPPVTNTGSGTVMGDPTASSESLTRSMDLIQRYQDTDLGLSRSMLNSLRSIDDSIGSLVTSLARQISGGAFSTEGLGLGTSTAGGFLGIGSTTRTSELAGRGLDLTSGSLATLIANGVSGSLYQLVENTKTRSGFLGIGGKTTSWMTEDRTTMDAVLSRELGQILASLRTGVLTAAGQLGIEGATATLDALQIHLGRIDFSGLSSSEIGQRLTQVFSAVGDQMAATLLPQIQQFQQAGEGLFETLIRLATQVQAVDGRLTALGMTVQMTGLEGIAARDRLVQLSGGLESFLDQTTFFAERFLSEQQRLAPIQAHVTAELTRMGLATDLTRQQFADLVLGLDVSTASGAAMFAALMQLAPAFDQAAGAVEATAARMAEEARRQAEITARIADQRRGLEIALLDATGQTTAALDMRRKAELEAMDESLRALQLQVWAAQDAAAAQAELARQMEEASRAAAQYQQQLMQGVEDARGKLTQAYQREAAEIQGVIDRFDGFATSLRAFRDTLSDQMPGATSYEAQRALFNRMATQARQGDETALSGLQGAAEAYLQSARANAASQEAYLFDLARVRRGVTDGIIGADAQKTVAEQQLGQLKDQVRHLIDLNENVLSVHQAIVDLHQAMSRAGVTAFATGGVFTNGVVNSPTVAPMALFGEAGPEAIMPLARGPNGLGVRASNDNGRDDALIDEIRSLKAEVASLRSEQMAANGAIASNTGKTARILDRVTPNGDAIMTEAAA